MTYPELETKYKAIYTHTPKAQAKGVIVVTGAPGAGKTTYAQEHAGSDDMVYDFDLIERAISRAQDKDTRPQWSYQMIDMIRGLMLAYRQVPTLWIVTTMASAWEKEYYALKHNARILVLDPGMDTCKQRVMDDDSRTDKEMWLGLVDKYYQDYRPYEGEEEA